MDRNPAVPTGAVARQEFGATEVARTAETAVTAAAAQARAQVEAMYVMALQRPRDMVLVREKLLAECKRPRFAETARWRLSWLKDSRGQPLRGPSIRFAEVAMRCLGNVHVSTLITYEDTERRMVSVTVIDLETNVPLCGNFTLEKTVERRSVREGQVVVGERVNSTGQTVFRVLASEQEVLSKQEALVSRYLRNLVLRILPGDLQDEAIEACIKTEMSGIKADPAGAGKRLVDALGSVGVTVFQIREYLGHPADQMALDEMSALKGVYLAIKDGASTWSQEMDARKTDQKNGAPQSPEDQVNRGAMVSRIAQLRIQDPPAHDAALAGCGVATGMSPAELPDDTLIKIVAHLDAAENAPQEVPPDTPAAPDPDDDPELDPATATWMDDAGEAPPADEVSS